MLKILLSVFLSVVAFITSVSSYFKQEVPAPEDAIHIAYGDGICENLNLFLPEDASGEIDVLLIIHGGAWLMGDESQYNDACRTAANDYGYAAATMDYSKLTNGATCADMVDEVALAVEKIDEALQENNLTADKMAVVGHSAGAQLALLYSYTRFVTSPIEIAFVMSLSAPSNFFDSEGKGTTVCDYRYLLTSCMTKEVIGFWNTDKTADIISSVTALDRVTGDVPPTLVVHGAKDTMVPYNNSVKLVEKLNECGVDCEFMTYPNSDHFLREDKDLDSERAQLFFTFAEKYF